MHGRSEVLGEDWSDARRIHRGTGEAELPAEAELPSMDTSTKTRNGAEPKSSAQNAEPSYPLRVVPQSPGSAARRAAIQGLSKELVMVNDYALRNRPILQLSQRSSASPESFQETSECGQFCAAGENRELELKSAKWWDWECDGCNLKFCSRMLYEEHLLECSRAILGYPLNKGSRTTIATTLCTPVHTEEDSFSTNTTNSFECPQQMQQEASNLHDQSSHSKHDPQNDASGPQASGTDPAARYNEASNVPINLPDAPIVIWGGGGIEAESWGSTEDAGTSGSRSAGEECCLPPPADGQRSDNGESSSRLSCASECQRKIQSGLDPSSYAYSASASIQRPRPPHGRVDSGEIGCTSESVADSLFDLSDDGSQIERCV